MGNAVWPLFLIVGSNLAYHLSTRGAAKDVNPFAALVIACVIAAAASLALFFATGRGAALGAQVRALNWANYALGFAIIGLEGASEVLEGGAEVVEFRAAGDEEAVVEDSGRLDRQRRVLFVELGDGCRGQGRSSRLLRRGGDDGGTNAFAGKEVERGTVAVVVDEDNAFRGLSDELAGEGPGIAVPPV